MKNKKVITWIIALLAIAIIAYLIYQKQNPKSTNNSKSKTPVITNYTNSNDFNYAQIGAASDYIRNNDLLYYNGTDQDKTKIDSIINSIYTSQPAQKTIVSNQNSGGLSFQDAIIKYVDDKFTSNL